MDGEDYVGIGPAWKTQTKKNLSAIVGVRGLGDMLKELDGTQVKAVAIGEYLSEMVPFLSTSHMHLRRCELHQRLALSTWVGIRNGPCAGRARRGQRHRSITGTEGSCRQTRVRYPRIQVGFSNYLLHPRCPVQIEGHQGKSRIAHTRCSAAQPPRAASAFTESIWKHAG